MSSLSLTLFALAAAALTAAPSPSARAHPRSSLVAADTGHADDDIRLVAALARNWRFERGPYAVETIVFPFTLEPGMVEKPRRQSA